MKYSHRSVANSHVFCKRVLKFDVSFNRLLWNTLRFWQQEGIEHSRKNSKILNIKIQQVERKFLLVWTWFFLPSPVVLKWSPSLQIIYTTEPLFHPSTFSVNLDAILHPKNEKYYHPPTESSVKAQKTGFTTSCT